MLLLLLLCDSIFDILERALHVILLLLSGLGVARLASCPQYSPTCVELQLHAAAGNLQWDRSLGAVQLVVRMFRRHLRSHCLILLLLLRTTGRRLRRRTGNM